MFGIHRRSASRAVSALLILGLVLPTTSSFAAEAGPDSTTWTIATPWWCYRTTKTCEKTNSDQETLAWLTGCKIGETGYYNNGNAYDMCTPVED
jgi:hypothetical protein